MVFSVLVVEDDAFTRATLVASLEQAHYEVRGPAGNLSDALESFHQHDHDLLLVDLDLGQGPSGIELANLLRKGKPSLGVVFLTSFEDPRLHGNNSALLPGGSRYLVKQALVSTEQIDQALNEARAAATQADTRPSLPEALGLTDVQIQTMKLVSQGFSNSEIAKQRYVSEKAVEKTIKLIAEQLQLAPDSSKNLRVSITRAYLKLTGGKA